MYSGSRRGYKRQHSSSESSVNVEDDENTETVNEQFRQGKNLDELGLDWGNNSDDNSDNSHDSDKQTEETNDSEWNMLGAALEKEFLENQ